MAATITLQGAHGIGYLLPALPDYLYGPATPAFLATWYISLKRNRQTEDSDLPMLTGHVLQLTHLRKIPYCPIPRRAFVQATHQISVSTAQAPVDCPHTLLEPPPVQHPPCHVVQLTAADDKTAYTLAARMVRHIIDGNCDPDPPPASGQRILFLRLVRDALDTI